MSATPGGFAHAPVTKGLLLASTGASLVAHASARSHVAGSRGAPLLFRGLGQGLAFKSPSQLLFAAFLLYQCRVIERQLGSTKYGAYVASVTGLSYILQLAASRLLRLPLAPLLPLPLPLALASLVPFALDVPATSSFALAGLAASEKAFVYLSGAQLLLAVGRRGLAAGALCLLAGALHRANFLGLRKLQLPQPLVRALSQAFGPLLSDGTGGPVVLLPGSAAARHPGAAAGRGGRRPAGGPPAGPPPEPSPEALATLLSMGFERARAVAALQRTHNDVQAAIAQLVG
ncbi:MAG: hypothetical protein J3K34DRAFT_456033 [Monoraphidium minutum]|nr:MAG: hypothetical protein J3K34DRAFT_456033 [Monoraphidium minutum]